MKTNLIIFSLFCSIISQDWSALDGYKNQRAADSLDRVSDSLKLDSIRKLTLSDIIDKDYIKKEVYIFDLRVDSLDKEFKKLKTLLYSDKYFKRMGERGFDSDTKKQYAIHLITYGSKTKSEIIDWFNLFLQALNIEHQMLYIAMDTQYGNTRANAFNSVRKKADEMQDIVDIINYFREK